jgi:isocitrate dehydrogenase (NAD+)
MGDDPRAAAESVMIITRYGAERIVRYAFEYAVRNGRKKVTLAHKANILKFTQGLFLEAGKRIAEEYAGRVVFEDRIIDATAMHLVLNPYQFDVLVMENMFGDILSDLMAGLVGGLGMAPGGNIGRDAAIFEPVHGSAPDLAGKGIANPTAMLLAGCMMLDHLGQDETSKRVMAALVSALHAGETITPDLGGSANTQAFADDVVRRLDRNG